LEVEVAESRRVRVRVERESSPRPSTTCSPTVTVYVPASMSEAMEPLTASAPPPGVSVKGKAGEVVEGRGMGERRRRPVKDMFPAGTMAGSASVATALGSSTTAPRGVRSLSTRVREEVLRVGGVSMDTAVAENFRGDW